MAQRRRRRERQSSDEEHPPEIAGPADEKADAEEEDAGYDIECAADVISFGEGEVVDDLEEGGEVGVPALVGDLIGEFQEAGADDGAVGEEVGGEERNSG